MCAAPANSGSVKISYMTRLAPFDAEGITRQGWRILEAHLSPSGGGNKLSQVRVITAIYHDGVTKLLVDVIGRTTKSCTIRNLLNTDIVVLLGRDPFTLRPGGVLKKKLGSFPNIQLKPPEKAGPVGPHEEMTFESEERFPPGEFAVSVKFPDQYSLGWKIGAARESKRAQITLSVFSSSCYVRIENLSDDDAFRYYATFKALLEEIEKNFAETTSPDDRRAKNLLVINKHLRPTDNPEEIEKLLKDLLTDLKDIDRRSTLNRMTSEQKFASKQ